MPAERDRLPENLNRPDHPPPVDLPGRPPAEARLVMNARSAEARAALNERERRPVEIVQPAFSRAAASLFLLPLSLLSWGPHLEYLEYGSAQTATAHSSAVRLSRGLYGRSRSDATMAYGVRSSASPIPRPPGLRWRPSMQVDRRWQATGVTHGRQVALPWHNTRRAVGKSIRLGASFQATRRQNSLRHIRKICQPPEQALSSKPG